MRGNANILVVDDDRCMVELIVDLLETEGYSAEGVTDPVEALESILHGAVRPDAVLLDCLMPRLNADGFIGAIARAHVSLAIILVSGAVDEMQQLADRVAGVVTKPFTSETLTRAIDQAIPRRSLRRCACGHEPPIALSA